MAYKKKKKDGIMKLRGAENKSIRPKIYLIRTSGKKLKMIKKYI